MQTLQLPGPWRRSIPPRCSRSENLLWGTHDNENSTRRPTVGPSWEQSLSVRGGGLRLLLCPVWPPQNLASAGVRGGGGGVSGLWVDSQPAVAKAESGAAVILDGPNYSSSLPKLTLALNFVLTSALHNALQVDAICIIKKQKTQQSQSTPPPPFSWCALWLPCSQTSSVPPSAVFN